MHKIKFTTMAFRNFEELDHTQFPVVDRRHWHDHDEQCLEELLHVPPLDPQSLSAFFSSTKTPLQLHIKTAQHEFPILVVFDKDERHRPSMGVVEGSSNQ